MVSEFSPIGVWLVLFNKLVPFSPLVSALPDRLAQVEDMRFTRSDCWCLNPVAQGLGLDWDSRKRVRDKRSKRSCAIADSATCTVSDTRFAERTAPDMSGAC